MYLPSYHEEKNIEVMHALMRAHPLGAWVMNTRDGIIANHIPFFLDSSRGECGTLVAHVARANPVWQLGSFASASMVIFQGPQGYITPSWYPGKHEHGKAVPTWNYTIVHAYGAARIIDDPAWLFAALNRLTDAHEASQSLPWKIADAPPEFIEQLLGAIIGLEIPLDRLVGKWKMHQQRPLADRLGVVAGLIERGDEDALAMAELMQRDGARQR